MTSSNGGARAVLLLFDIQIRFIFSALNPVMRDLILNPALCAVWRFRSGVLCFCMNDPVNNPNHYTSNPSGIECIDVVEHMDFLTGNIFKYLWRCDIKGNKLQDMKKARWYLDRAIRNEEKRIELNEKG